MKDVRVYCDLCGREISDPTEPKTHELFDGRTVKDELQFYLTIAGKDKRQTRELRMFGVDDVCYRCREKIQEKLNRLNQFIDDLYSWKGEGE